jgi:hypothetical protein
VLLGWLSERGKPNSELAAIGKPGQLSGTPSVATNEAQVLVSFANRDDPQAPWQIVAGTAPLGEVPKQAAPLAGLPVADGAAAISPAVVGLHGGGWLLQWTEGSGSAYRVRLQVLNQQLEPVSTTLEASPKGQNSGQGAVWADGERALSLFIVSRGNEKELWARSLRCR